MITKVDNKEKSKSFPKHQMYLELRDKVDENELLVIEINELRRKLEVEQYKVIQITK